MVKTVKEISTVRRIAEVALLCLTDGKIGMFCGPAGTGKTTACKYFSETNKNAVYFLAKPHYTAKSFFAELSLCFGISPRGSVIGLYNAVRARIMDEKILLIVDQSEYLSHSILELLRNLHDEAGCGLLLVGLEELKTNIYGSRGEYAQLSSRISIYQKTLPLTLKDVEEYLKSVEKIKDPCKFSGEILKITRGNFRVLDNLLWRAVRIAEIHKEDINKEIITAAKEGLL